MTSNTKIEWADHTFNPWIGCTRVSTAETGGGGCDNCYAATQDNFRHWTPEGWGGPRKRTKTWGEPKKWEKAHAEFFARHGRRQRVFCASLADVFDNQVPTEWRMDLFKLIADTPNLDWLLLTKRIGNVMPMCSGDSLMLDMISERVWLGATVVNQEEADRDIPKLLAVPAHKRFLSMEPLLGPVELFSSITGELLHTSGDDFNPGAIDWVIVGGESGPGARPMHPDWARSLRDQCQAAGVPFLFKQWGEYVDTDGGRGAWLGKVHKTDPDLHLLSSGTATAMWQTGATAMHRVGKKSAGRLLDGREWNGVPA